ncbi:MAG: hypothetical protein AAF846_28420 [Chloroflexota bacterium]
MKPIAWRHMVFWGAVSGAIAGGIYFLILGFTWVFILAGAQIGMVLGVFLGIISGILIENLLPIETQKFNQDYQLYMIMCTLVVSLVCATVTYPLTGITLDTLFPLDASYAWRINPTLLYVPSIFAMIGSGYATHHYLTRLRRYTLPPRKSKQVEEKVKRLEISDEQISNSNHQHRHTLHSQQWRQHHDET